MEVIEEPSSVIEGLRHRKKSDAPAAGEKLYCLCRKKDDGR